jgi:hypothetical protein
MSELDEITNSDTEINKKVVTLSSTKSGFDTDFSEI